MAALGGADARALGGMPAPTLSQLPCPSPTRLLLHVWIVVRPRAYAIQVPASSNMLVSALKHTLVATHALASDTALLRIFLNGKELDDATSFAMLGFFEGDVVLAVGVFPRDVTSLASTSMYMRPCLPTHWPSELKQALDCALRSMSAGTAPHLAADGLSGSYFLLGDDDDGCTPDSGSKQVPVAVFKPRDEEYNAPLNPKGHARSMHHIIHDTGLRSGEGYVREAAAYVLDHEGFANVLPTGVVEAWHPRFNNVEQDARAVRSNKRVYGPPIRKVGSFQLFARGCLSASPSGAGITTLQAQALALLDMRLLNVDRNEDNAMVRKRADGTHELIPIDHGRILPPGLGVSDFEWGWMFWEQVREPILPEVAAYIERLDIEADVQLLRAVFGPHISDSSLLTLRTTTTFIKQAVRKGMNLIQIACCMCRDADHPNFSQLERLAEHSEHLLRQDMQRGVRAMHLPSSAPAPALPLTVFRASHLEADDLAPGHTKARAEAAAGVAAASGTVKATLRPPPVMALNRMQTFSVSTASARPTAAPDVHAASVVVHTLASIPSVSPSASDSLSDRSLQQSPALMQPVSTGDAVDVASLRVSSPSTSRTFFPPTPNANTSCGEDADVRGAADADREERVSDKSTLQVHVFPDHVGMVATPQGSPTPDAVSPSNTSPVCVHVTDAVQATARASFLVRGRQRARLRFLPLSEFAVLLGLATTRAEAARFASFLVGFALASDVAVAASAGAGILAASTVSSATPTCATPIHIAPRHTPILQRQVSVPLSCGRVGALLDPVCGAVDAIPADDTWMEELSAALKSLRAGSAPWAALACNTAASSLSEEDEDGAEDAWGDGAPSGVEPAFALHTLLKQGSECATFLCMGTVMDDNLHLAAATPVGRDVVLYKESEVLAALRAVVSVLMTSMLSAGVSKKLSTPADSMVHRRRASFTHPAVGAAFACTAFSVYKSISSASDASGDAGGGSPFVSRTTLPLTTASPASPLPTGIPLSTRTSSGASLPPPPPIFLARQTTLRRLASYEPTDSTSTYSSAFPSPSSSSVVLEGAPHFPPASDACTPIKVAAPEAGIMTAGKVRTPSPTDAAVAAAEEDCEEPPMALALTVAGPIPITLGATPTTKSTSTDSSSTLVNAADSLGVADTGSVSAAFVSAIHAISSCVGTLTLRQAGSAAQCRAAEMTLAMRSAPACPITLCRLIIRGNSSDSLHHVRTLRMADIEASLWLEQREAVQQPVLPPLPSPPLQPDESSGSSASDVPVMSALPALLLREKTMAVSAASQVRTSSASAGESVLCSTPVQGAVDGAALRMTPPHPTLHRSGTFSSSHTGAPSSWILKKHEAGGQVVGFARMATSDAAAGSSSSSSGSGSVPHSKPHLMQSLDDASIPASTGLSLTIGVGGGNVVGAGGGGSLTPHHYIVRGPSALIEGTVTVPATVRVSSMNPSAVHRRGESSETLEMRRQHYATLLSGLVDQMSDKLLAFAETTPYASRN